MAIEPDQVPVTSAACIAATNVNNATRSLPKVVLLAQCTTSRCWKFRQDRANRLYAIGLTSCAYPQYTVVSVGVQMNDAHSVLWWRRRPSCRNQQQRRLAHVDCFRVYLIQYLCHE